MAERLESGQIQLRTVNAAPMQQVVPRQVDYQVAAREQAQYANTMAQLLDRMGATINKTTQDKRQEEAFRYAAENPITPEQLALAKDGMTAAVPGLGRISSDFNVYGQALKKARTLQLASAFEQEGLNELVKIQNDVKNGTITSEQAQLKIASLNKGYTDSLAKEDAEAAIKFNATFSTHGNTVLKTAYEEEAKRIKSQRTIKLRETWNNTKQLLEATVSQGEYIDPNTGQKYSIDVLVDTLRSNMSTQALSTGDVVLHKEIMADFEKEVREAKINAVTRHILSDDALMADPIGTRKKIMKAELNKMGPVMVGLLTNDMEAVAKIFANMEVALNQREGADKDKKAAEKEAAVKEFTPLYIEAIALPETSPKRKALVAKINEIARAHPDAVPLGVVKDLNEPPKTGEGAGSLSVWSTLWNRIRKNEITDIAQIDKYRSQLSKEDYRSLVKYLGSEERRDANDLEQGINRLADIPTIPGTVIALDEKGEKFKRRQELKARALEIQAQYEREGKAVTPRQVLNDLEADIAKRRNSEGAKKARQQLDDVWSKRPWINGPITRKGLSALENNAKGDANKQRELAQIKKLLDQAEGR